MKKSNTIFLFTILIFAALAAWAGSAPVAASGKASSPAGTPSVKEAKPADAAQAEMKRNLAVHEKWMEKRRAAEAAKTAGNMTAMEKKARESKGKTHAKPAIANPSGAK